MVGNLRQILGIAIVMVLFVALGFMPLISGGTLITGQKDPAMFHGSSLVSSL